MQLVYHPLNLPTSFFKRYCISRFASDNNCLLISPKKPANSVVFALHGGGFLLPPAVVHFKFWHELAMQTSCYVVVCLYPRLPDATVYSSLRMVAKAYRAADNFATSNQLPIKIVADSAGGGLALLLLQKRAKANDAQPQACILISPWLDLTLSDPKIALYERFDTMLSKQMLTPLAHRFSGTLTPNNPLINPLLGSLDNLCLLQIFSGGKDMLAPDTIQLVKKLAQTTTPWTLYFDEKAGHDFILYQSAAANAAKRHLFARMTNKKAKDFLDLNETD